MVPSNNISRPSDQPHQIRILSLLSTQRGRRSAMFSSVQCLLSVVGSMGIILLFAGIPQLIYSPTVTLSNIITFLMGALLLTVMVGGNACLGYRYKAEMEELRGVINSQAQAELPVIDDKPPNYDDLWPANNADTNSLPPDYYTLVYDDKNRKSSLLEDTPLGSMNSPPPSKIDFRRSSSAPDSVFLNISDGFSSTFLSNPSPQDESNTPTYFSQSSATATPQHSLISSNAPGRGRRPSSRSVSGTCKVVLVSRSPDTSVDMGGADKRRDSLTVSEEMIKLV